MSYNWKAIGDALGIEHVWVNEAEYEDCFTPGNYATGWGFQEGEKNPRYSGGEEAYRLRRNANRKTPEGRVRGAKRMEKYREKNRDAYNEYQREYRKKNNEKSRAYAQAYRDKDRDAYNKHIREYRASKRAA